jgi:protein-S-isoprenylcysteine O-methyltransferase Ste14
VTMFGQWVNVVVRELVWLAAFVFWAYFKKPADASFLAIRLDLVQVAGLGLVVAGVIVHLWSALVLAKAIGSPAIPTGDLAKRGPYHYVRNPLYLAGAAVFVGLYLIYAEFRLADIVAAAIVGLLLHWYVVNVEEPATRKRLGAIYDEYFRQVPRWMPRFSSTLKRNRSTD